MISRITQLVSKVDVSTSELEKELKEAYASCALGIPGLEHLEIDRVVKKDRGDASLDDCCADAFIVERYADLASYQEAVCSEEAERADEVLSHCAQRRYSYVCLENVSIPLDGKKEHSKKMSVLGRSVPDVSFEDFTREWFVHHSNCMMRLPQDVFFGYNQHLIIDRRIDGVPAAYDELPYDGILELFQSSADDVAHVFAEDPLGKATVAHRKDFMSSVSPFQVVSERLR